MKHLLLTFDFRLSTILALLVLTLFACQHNEDTAPGLFSPGKDAQPQWVHIPSRETFNTMTAIVQIPDTFAAYLSERDAMAVFSDKGTILASTSPFQDSVNAVNQYWLTVEQPKGNQQLTVKWYCDKLTRIYTAQDFPDFVVNDRIGTAEQPYVLTIISK